MPCYHPLDGYRSRVREASGKRRIVFDTIAGFPDMPVSVPCGQCIGCRLSRSREWAVRCMHEASLYERNCFITLTYDDACVPEFGSLVVAHFQRFMKRLRKRFADERIRFYHCGEYGSISGRPHYHALLFNFDFPDKTLWSVRRRLPVWRSAALESLWPYGMSEIGTVTYESAAYCARYIVGKVLGAGAEDAYSRLDVETGEVVRVQAEYTTMSRRPGIGAEWMRRFGAETYAHDSVVVRGRLQKPPRFYDGMYELCDPADFRRVEIARKRARNLLEETEERLEAREECRLAQVTRMERSGV